MVDGDSARDIGQNGLAIFVDGQEEISAGCKSDSRNVFAMREWKSMGLVSVRVKVRKPSD